MDPETRICVACGAAEMKPLVTIPRTPVLCGVTWEDEHAARDSAAGDMSLHACPACAHVYNAAYDPALLEYDEEYDNSLYHSGTYRAYADHLIDHLARSYGLRGKSVVEVGSGKGDFIVELCRQAECVGIGYDRSYDGRFEDERVTFVRDYLRWDDAPKFDFFVSRHVVEHLVDPYEFLRGLRTASNGRPVQGYIEVPDAISDFERSGWDCIYPHVSYFSATSLERLAVRAGFAVLRLVRNFQGQFLGLEIGANTPTPEVPPTRGMGLRREREILAEFAERYPRVVAGWKARLDEIGPERCVLWGAGAKGVSFLNAVDPDARMGAVVDLNPNKWGRYLPVTGHRVEAPSALTGTDVGLVVITNPAYSAEITDELAGMDLHPSIEAA
jgi:hypothetical protein